MSDQMGTRPVSYADTITGLKKELQTHVANLKSATEWSDFERLYRALRTVEELAGAPKTTLEELLGIVPASPQETSPQSPENNPTLESGSTR